MGCIVAGTMDGGIFIGPYGPVGEKLGAIGAGAGSRYPALFLFKGRE